MSFIGRQPGCYSVIILGYLTMQITIFVCAYVRLSTIHVWLLCILVRRFIA